jgi:tRNA(Ile)-lysidine synthase
MPNAPDDEGPSAELTARFRADLARIAPIDGEARFGIAVSGGSDSMALLLLAHAVLPGRIAAATVDHGLRPAAADEAAMVARSCAAMGIPHATLPVVIAGQANVQAAARDARYAALSDWARGQGLAGLVTAHHADDQAETLLMRLARGAGLSGLRGISERRDLGGLLLLRPLLRWRKAELAAIAASVETIEDPSNVDSHYDRTHARALLRDAAWIDPLRLAASADHLADAEAALEWMTTEAIRSRCEQQEDGSVRADIEGLPHDLRRRILGKLIAQSDSPADGPTIERALARLDAGQVSSVGALKLTPGRRIMIERAPDRA